MFSDRCLIGRQVFFHGPAGSLVVGCVWGFYVPRIKTLVPFRLQASSCGGAAASPRPVSAGTVLSRARCQEVAARPRRPRELRSAGGPRVPSADGGDGRRAAGAAAAPQPLPAPGPERERFAGLGGGGRLSPPAWVGTGCSCRCQTPPLSPGTNSASCISVADRGSEVQQKLVTHRVCATQRTAGVIFASADWQ